MYPRFLIALTVFTAFIAVSCSSSEDSSDNNPPNPTTADILGSVNGELDAVRASFEAGNVHDLFPLLNSNKVSLQGKGSLLVAMIASLHRNGKRFQTIDMHPPNGEKNGYFGAYICK